MVELKAEDAPQPKERSDKDYAIEHAGYLADAVDHYLEERNKFDALDQADVGDQDSLNDHVRALRDCAFEFRKRAKRATSPKVDAQREDAPLRGKNNESMDSREVAHAESALREACASQIAAFASSAPIQKAAMGGSYPGAPVHADRARGVADLPHHDQHGQAIDESGIRGNSPSDRGETEVVEAADAPAKPALEKLLRWIVEDTRELAKGRSLEMSDIESLLAHADEACQSVFGCSLSSLRDGEQGEPMTKVSQGKGECMTNSNWPIGKPNSLTTREQVANLGMRLKARASARNDISAAAYWHALAEESIRYVFEILKWSPVASPTRPEPQWTSVKDKEPPHGDVLLVVINKTVQHMPAIWDGTEWIWLDSSDEDDPVPTDKITHWSRLPKYPGSRTIQSDPRERQEYWEAGRDAAAAACEKMCVTCYDRDSCHSDDIEAISALTYPGTLSPKHDSTETRKE